MFILEGKEGMMEMLTIVDRRMGAVDYCGLGIRLLMSCLPHI